MKKRIQPQSAIWSFGAFIHTWSIASTAVCESVIIDFESDVIDTRGVTFTSNDSSLATFSSRFPLWVRRGLPEFDGTGLESFGSPIVIEFAKPVTSLSILFGNDDPSVPEDRALLRAFQDSELVGQEILLFNRNDLPDQTITIAPQRSFNRAVFEYVDHNLQPASGLGEVISEVRFTVVPEASATVLAVTLAIMAPVARRRSLDPTGRRSTARSARPW